MAFVKEGEILLSLTILVVQSSWKRELPATAGWKYCLSSSLCSIMTIVVSSSYSAQSRSQHLEGGGEYREPPSSTSGYLVKFLCFLRLKVSENKLTDGRGSGWHEHRTLKCLSSPNPPGWQPTFRSELECPDILQYELLSKLVSAKLGKMKLNEAKL